jgi:hypothetical protein
VPIRARFHSRAMERDMNDLLKKVDRRSGRVAIRAAVELRKRLAQKNPKKTGRSAASWNLSVNRGIRAQKPIGYNNVKGAVQDGTVKIENFKPGDKLVISNTIGYLPDLERGSSKQAPNGFIRNSILFIEAKMRLGAYSR